MGSCSCNPLFTGFNNPKLSHSKRRLHGSQRRPSKVIAYYGLKSPPYKLDALEPYMGKRTLEMHWGDHHRGYVEALNKHLEKNDLLYAYTLDELVKLTYNNGNPLPEFNDAAQKQHGSFQEILHKLRILDAKYERLCGQYSSAKSQNGNADQKLSFPKFDNYKAEQYFEVQTVLVDYQVQIASFHVEGEASKCFPRCSTKDLAEFF